MCFILVNLRAQYYSLACTSSSSDHGALSFINSLASLAGLAIAGAMPAAALAITLATVFCASCSYSTEGAVSISSRRVTEES